jgi:hypothetical protein
MKDLQPTASRECSRWVVGSFVVREPSTLVFTDSDGSVHGDGGLQRPDQSRCRSRRVSLGSGDVLTLMDSQAR